MNKSRIVILTLLLAAVLLLYFRNEVRIGYEFLGSRLLPSFVLGGTSSASDAPAWAKVELKPFASGFTLPVYLANAGDGSGRAFVVEKPGLIKIVKDGKVLPEPFLDIENRVRSKESERGLLSVAFHPDYTENGRFFVNYTDLNGDTVVSEYTVGDNPDRSDRDSEKILLTIEQPASNHNGGQIQFGPDGYLYIGMGDGGSAGDPWGNAQNMDALLGKMLRIDVDGEKPYAIPADNPFKDRPGARPEIWAYGLRNPWRFSFDSKTGDMYIADVGQNKWEEVDFQPAGRGGLDYGWKYTEGFHSYEMPRGYDTSGITFPVLEYGREDGCSITGGYVYRGKKYPGLDGTYLFADFCTGKLWGLRKKDDGSWESSMLLDTDLQVSSFGEDEEGGVYIIDYGRGGILTIASTAE